MQYIVAKLNQHLVARSHFSVNFGSLLSALTYKNENDILKAVLIGIVINSDSRQLDAQLDANKLGACI